MKIVLGILAIMISTGPAMASNLELSCDFNYIAPKTNKLEVINVSIYQMDEGILTAEVKFESGQPKLNLKVAKKTVDRKLSLRIVNEVAEGIIKETSHPYFQAMKSEFWSDIQTIQSKASWGERYLVGNNCDDVFCFIEIDRHRDLKGDVIGISAIRPPMFFGMCR